MTEMSVIGNEGDHNIEVCARLVGPLDGTERRVHFTFSWVIMDQPFGTSCIHV